MTDSATKKAAYRYVVETLDNGSPEELRPEVYDEVKRIRDAMAQAGAIELPESPDVTTKSP